jgi:uncharacterized protein YjdB
MKSILQFSIMIVIAMMVVTSCREEDNNISVTGLNLMNQDDFATIVVGDTYRMTVNVEPSNATEKGVIWTSSNAGVASVLGGVITANLPGIAEIAATTVDGAKSVSIEVIVTNPAAGIVFGSNLKIAVGEKVFPKYGFMPPGATDRMVRWSSSDENIATIDATTGEITGMKFGTAAITAVLLANENITGSCTVEVMPIAVTGVTLTPKTLNLEIGATTTPVYATIPSNAENQGVTWSTSDANIATVDESTGLVTGIAEGQAAITVTTLDGGFTDNCLVTVNTAVEPTEFVRVDADLADWTGKYLIIYEAQALGANTYQGKTVLAFNGGLSGQPVNGPGNIIVLSPTIPGTPEDLALITGGIVAKTETDVTVTGGRIELSEAIKPAIITIAAAAGGWSIKTGGGYYIGGADGESGNPGTLGVSDTFDATRHVHTISIGSTTSSANNNTLTFKNCAIITCNTANDNKYMRVNAGTGRFGYWPANGQHPVALYKLQ